MPSSHFRSRLAFPFPFALPFFSILIFLCQSSLILSLILLIKLFSIYFSVIFIICVYFWISFQCLINLSQKYFVGRKYFYFHARANDSLMWDRYAQKDIGVLGYLYFVSTSQPITNFQQKSQAGFSTFTFVPSYMLFQLISRMFVTKLLATCQGCFLFRNLVI